jgi:hypothetical protein
VVTGNLTGWSRRGISVGSSHGDVEQVFYNAQRNTQLKIQTFELVVSFYLILVCTYLIHLEQLEGERYLP